MNIHITKHLITVYADKQLDGIPIVDKGYGFTAYKNTDIALCHALNLKIDYLVLFGLDLTDWSYICEPKHVITSMCIVKPMFFNMLASECSAKISCCDYTYIPKYVNQLHSLDLTHSTCIYKYALEYSYTGHIVLRYSKFDKKKIISNMKLLKFGTFSIVSETFNRPTKSIMREFNRL
jgi:hypothetical protein